MMSITASKLPTVNPARMRSFILPREHGAWGILLIPLVTGGLIGCGAGGRLLPIILFAVAALALFCLRTPVEAWLEMSPLRAQTPEERHAVFYSILVYTSIATVAVASLLWRECAHGLLVLGAVVAALFLAQAILKKLSRQNRMAAQLIGALALTSAAVGAYYVGTGQIDSQAVLLWGVNWLFAANQIHFVQLRIRAARAASRAQKFAEGRSFLVGEALTVLLLAVAWNFRALPGTAAWAFGPVLARGLIWFSRPPAPLGIHRLGLSEMAHAVAFGALLILGFKL